MSSASLSPYPPMKLTLTPSLLQVWLGCHQNSKGRDVDIPHVTGSHCRYSSCHGKPLSQHTVLDDDGLSSQLLSVATNTGASATA